MRIIIILSLLLTISVAAFGATMTIYDIQFTTNSNGISPQLNNVVTTEGIVTGVNYIGGRYVIAEASGTWRGIFINDPDHSPILGDKVSVTGTVAEVSQLTEINSITAYSVISSGNELPAAIAAVPANFAYNTGEPYEAVLVKLSNVHVSVAPFNGAFSVSDSGNIPCSIKDGFFTQPYPWPGVVINQVWTEINGIVSFNTGSFRVNPRSESDMIPLSDINAINLKINDVEAKKGETVSVNVSISKLDADWNLDSYSFKLGFDKRTVQFVDVNIDGTLSTIAPTVDLSTDENELTVTYHSETILSSTNNSATLIKLLFKTKGYGESVLDLIEGTVTSASDSVTNIAFLNDGKIKIPIKKQISWLSIYKDNNHKNNIFNPWLNERITIEYGSKITVGTASSKAIIRIYDVQGRLVATPVNKNMDDANAYGLSTYLWDGRDRNRNLLPVGVYYCHLEIINRVTGDSETTIQPIVVASKLN